MPSIVVRAVSLLSILALASPAAAADPPAATVPEPPPITAADLPDLYNHAHQSQLNDPQRPVELRVDLDLLAPLGTGAGNAATFLADFVLHDGARVGEWKQAQERRSEYQDVGWVLPVDDPLLVAAEPWVDQARCSFFPEHLAFQGWATPVPNLLMVLDLGRSWLARGRQATTPAAAEADFRRTVRLGRLLLQEDEIAVQTLVGLALVRMGAEELYRSARARDDAARAALAGLVAQEAMLVRMETILKTRLASDAGHQLLTGTGDTDDLDVLRALAGSDSGVLAQEAAYQLAAVAAGAPEPWSDRAAQALRDLARSDRPAAARLARWYRDHPMSAEAVKMAAEAHGPFFR